MAGITLTSGGGRMNIGSEIEAAIWYDAGNCIDPVNDFGDSIKEGISQMCLKHSVVCGGTEYEVLKPGDDRVPRVPKWLEKIDGSIPRLLVARTRIIATASVQNSIGIIGDLDHKDVMRLRALTRMKYQQLNPGSGKLTDQQCDEIIDTLGLEVVLEQLGSGSIH